MYKNLSNNFPLLFTRYFPSNSKEKLIQPTKSCYDGLFRFVPETFHYNVSSVEKKRNSQTLS